MWAGGLVKQASEPNLAGQIYTSGVDAGRVWRYSLRRYRIWSPTPSRIADWPHAARYVPVFSPTSSRNPNQPMLYSPIAAAG